MARCDRELKAGRPAPRGTAADVLTEQEPTVAAFVATGRSNKEVAADDAVRPNPGVAGTSVAFAGEAAYAQLLHQDLAADGIHVAQLIVPGSIVAGHPRKDPGCSPSGCGACTRIVQSSGTSLTTSTPDSGARVRGRSAFRGDNVAAHVASSGGRPPVAIGPQRSMVIRSKHLSRPAMAARYSSQSGCSPAMPR